jgi:hypothetical protein
MSQRDCFPSARVGFLGRANTEKRITFSFFAILTLILLPGVLFGQVTTATLSGTVQDTSGAVVPNADIILENTLNGDMRNGKSDGAGVFAFPSVPSGDYQVTITADGFQKYTATKIHLDPGDQRALRDIHLAIGGATQSVTVTADTQINTDSGEQSALIDSEQIQHLAIEGRDVTELFKTLPGFAITNGSTGTDNRAYDPSQVSVNGALGTYAANGTPLNGVALLTDGADITDPGNFGAAIQNVNYEQVAEVKVQTSSFTADTAHGPIVVNAVGKSGGDKFHGSLYTYARTNQLDSNDWISNYTQQAKAPDREVYPGLTFGGPVVIPHTNFNKDKHLTFFVGAEDYAQRNVYAYGSASSAVLTALVPTAGMRNGDFSATQLQQFLGSSYQPIGNGSICQGGNYQAVCAIPQTGPTGAALQNGQVTNIDKNVQNLLSTLPLPNTPSTGTYNWITTNLVNNDLWEAHARVDDQISQKHKLFIVYTKEAGAAGVPQNEYYSARGTFGGTNVPGGGLKSTINSEIGSFNFTSILSPTLTNELFGQGAFLLQNFVAANQNDLLSSTIGYGYNGVYANKDLQFPTLEDYGNLPVNRTPDTSDGGIYAKKWIRGGGDNLTKLIGAHTVKVGFFTELSNNNEVNAFQNPNGTISSIGFSTNTFQDPIAGLIYNTGPTTGDGTNAGNSIANFLEGHVQTFTQQNINVAPDLYFWNISGYAQDHWRVSTRLSVDIGLRIEHLTPWEDTRSAGVPVWVPSSYNSGLSPLPGFLWHGIDPSIPKGGLATRGAFFEPRVGLAWDPRGNGQTVVRAGYGIYRAHDSFNDATAGIGTAEGARTATVNKELLSTISATQTPITGGSSTAFQDTNAFGFTPNDNNQPQVYTYNAAIDQKVPFNTTFELAYVGNRSDHLLDNGSNGSVVLDDQNALPIGSLYGGNIPTQVGAQTAATSQLSTHQIDQYRAYPFYQHIEAASHWLYANYNALQAGWTKQGGPLRFSVNYTFSKALGVLGAYANGNPADPINIRNDYMPEDYDRTHIFNANYSYEFGKLSSRPYLRVVTNGWQLSGITQIQSGQNVQSILSPNFGLTGSLNQTTNLTPVSAQALLGTPDYMLMPNITCNPGIGVLPNQRINASCFQLPSSPGVQGTYHYPYIHAPAFTDSDLTATKDFHIGESGNLQFRAAAFNFLNHANSSFSSSDKTGSETALNLSNTLNGATEQSAKSSNSEFGIVPLREGRRIMELSLKYTF